MAEKNYIPSNIKRVTTQYGELFNVAIKVDDLQAIAKKGWANITIAERREVSEKGATHYAFENTYDPEQKKEVEDKDDNDVPF
tara:strand:+ start:322 stop:570 length:249 start_codon:yes stop_codon:yes gene_type:complete